MHSSTFVSLKKKGITARHIGLLLQSTEQHAQDLLDGRVPVNSHEEAVLRLCANVRPKRLHPILDDLNDGYAWKRIPGYSRYEASEHGQVRRAAAGHGGMPGHVLRPRSARWGHWYVNIAPDGERVKSVGVHVAVCLAFHGPAPSPGLIVCHRDDCKDNNAPENLYWGTHAENAQDRVRNAKFRYFDTRLTRRPTSGFEPTPLQVKKANKKQMLERLKANSKK